MRIQGTWLRTASIVLAIIGTGSLVACSTSTPEQSIPPSTTAPSPTPSPTETAEPDPAASSCETVLTDEEYQRLADDGLTLREDDFVLGPVMESMVAAGALSCHWVKPQTDIALWYAELPLDAAALEAKRAELLAAGFTPSDDPIAGTLLAPSDYDSNYQPAVLLQDGTMYFVSMSPFLSSIAHVQD